MDLKQDGRYRADQLFDQFGVILLVDIDLGLLVLHEDVESADQLLVGVAVVEEGLREVAVVVLLGLVDEHVYLLERRALSWPGAIIMLPE